MSFSRGVFSAALFGIVLVFIATVTFDKMVFKPGWSGCGSRNNCTEIYQTSAKSDYSRIVRVVPKPGFLASEGWD